MAEVYVTQWKNKRSLNACNVHCNTGKLFVMASFFCFSNSVYITIYEMIHRFIVLSLILDINIYIIKIDLTYLRANLILGSGIKCE